MHFFETLELLFGFLQDLVGHLCVFDPFAEFRDFFRPFIEFAQLLLNGFQLFTQEILPLGLVHLPFGLRLDLVLHGEDFDFLSENVAHVAKALNWIGDFQNGLGGIDFEAEIRSHHVG